MKKMILSFYLFVIVLFVILVFVTGPIVGKIMEPKIKDDVEVYCRKALRGMYHVLIKDMLEIPMEKWPDHVEALNIEFMMPNSLDLYEDLGFSDKERTEFLDGKIIVRKMGTLFHKRVGNSPYALTIPALPKYEIGIPYYKLGQLVTILMIVGIVTVIWVRPFWRKLQNISMAATDFGNGRFDVRAEVPKFSALAHLAVTFNSMAERIQHLITSHKDLVNSVSHELRTPISRIRFGMEMLGTAKNDSERNRQLDGIIGDVDELEELVAELLDYARFDREAVALEFEEAEVGPWLVGEVGKAKAGTDSFAWECRFDPSGKLTARFEKRFMGRILSNLLQNAIRYAKSRIEVVLETENGDCLIHVDDDGPGIPEDSRDQIFKPFVRLDTSRDRQSGGYGLGLAIVDRLAALHGGRVDISESPLGGARFTIRWPIS